ncbi:DUF2533 family protein [Halalkalibacterium ligniniphilum]|uniref:DUF2533 family protein n=1 Tax=Halalkalibacterium ligniniphilum TaxID=1134413 RepID=UPI00034875EC|nr:DUF2533 family protein [Halalkalibacterium ligniniphilum]
MSVHLQIAEQVKNHRKAQADFLAFDKQRELAIVETLAQAKQGKSFSVQKINHITKQMNDIAKRFQFPTRKEVTTAMVIDYLNKQGK